MGRYRRNDDCEVQAKEYKLVVSVDVVLLHLCERPTFSVLGSAMAVVLISHWISKCFLWEGKWLRLLIKITAHQTEIYLGCMLLQSFNGKTSYIGEANTF